MKRLFLSLFGLASMLPAAAQLGFDPSIDFEAIPDQVVVKQSPLTKQVLFIGGVDLVQTKSTYGNPAGPTPAKQWHDFIGFTADTASGSQDLGWITINHERISMDDMIGDGGGMTVFKVRRDPTTDTLIVVNQTLNDGRTGKFFNVDFVNTVGETGMNCGGIQSEFDGRIWTAEEWFRSNNESIYDDGDGVRDTADWTISGSGIPAADGQTISKYQNFNWMVEVDPREAVAIRKQYNWGRQPFEGGVVMPDNKTVYIGGDGTPGFLTKFVATVPGDFTSGVTYVYKHDIPAKWVVIDNNNFSKMLNFEDEAVAVGATMFNRIEWVAYNPADGNVYFTETGRDNPASRWADEKADGAVFAPHHINRAQLQVPGSTPDSSSYYDYYGRVMMLDVNTDDVSVFLEAGPEILGGTTISQYPDHHLSNPDGLVFMEVGSETFMVICEDLNGTSAGRMPDGACNRTCEMFLLDMSITTPNLDDLVRVAEVPIGAEITGARATPDGKTLLFNSQHPSTSNPYPYNNSLTIALSGWDQFITSIIDIDEETNDFNVFPNPTSRLVQFNQTTDIALYDSNGKLIKVKRNTNQLDVSGFASGVYFLQNKDGQSKKLIIE